MFKIGDKVVTKSYQELVNMNKAPFPKSLRHYCGKKAIIKKVLKEIDNSYLLDISGTFIWNEFELSIDSKNTFIPLQICLS